MNSKKLLDLIHAFGLNVKIPSNLEDLTHEEQLKLLRELDQAIKGVRFNAVCEIEDLEESLNEQQEIVDDCDRALSELAKELHQVGMKAGFIPVPGQLPLLVDSSSL